MWVYIKSNIDVEEVYYNDANPFLSNTFLCLREPEKLLPLLEEKKTADRDFYYENLKEFKKIEKCNQNDFETAALYLYCLCHSFSGLMNGFSKEAAVSYSAVIKRLRNQEIRDKLKRLNVLNLSFEEVIERLDCEGGFFYLDPPYHGKESLYVIHPFTIDDHKKLADILKSNLKSRWALSYYFFDDLKEWFPQDKYRWEIKKFHRGSGNRLGRTREIAGEGEEILIMNYEQKDELDNFFA